MNKADIMIAHIKKCYSRKEAMELVTHPTATVGIRLTKVEQTFCFEIVNLYFAIDPD